MDTNRMRQQQADLSKLMRNSVRKVNQSTSFKNHVPIYMLLFLLLLVPNKSVVAEDPCAISSITTQPTEDCTLEQDRLHCKIATNMRIPLISFDQTSCGYSRADDGTILYRIEVTPVEVAYRCSKESLYFSREVELTFNTQEHCPGAGQCDETWCLGVDNTTKVDGWDSVDAPMVQFCKFGESCAAHGCFYCTRPTCHPIRYYPKPMNDKIYEVFRCGLWEPYAKMIVKIGNNKEDLGTKIMLKDTQNMILDSQTTINLELQSKDVVPSLSKTFLTDGKFYASVETSPPGQPTTGNIGQLQCQTLAIAKDFKKCTMAKDVCKCVVEFTGAGCDCVDVSMDKALNGPDHLPLSILNHRLELQDGEVVLKTPAYGSGFINVKVQGRISVLSEHKHHCILEIIRIEGCYNCLPGAGLVYQCISDEKFSTMLDCGDVKTIIHCGPSSAEKVVKVQLSTQLVTLSCSAQCSKTAKTASGTLEYISHPELSDASHMQLIPPPELSKWSDITFSFLSFIGMKYILMSVGVTLVMWWLFKLILGKFSRPRYRSPSLDLSAEYHRYT